MIWVSIILGIIEAIPSIINLIKLILAAIHGQTNLTDRLMLVHEFESHLLNWHLDKDHPALEAAMKGLAGRLGVVVP